MKPGLVHDMPFLTDDWLLSPSIAAMTPAEEGGYIRLLCYAWRDPDCCLPDDDETLAGMSRLGPAWADGSRARIRKNFRPDPKRPGFIFNAKQRQLRVDQTERITEAHEQRRSAANSRWHRKRKPCDRNATGLRPDCGSNASLTLPLSKSEDSTGAVKPLPSFPKTPEEAIAALPIHFQDQHDFVNKTWHKANSRGGRDAKDLLIRNWPSYVAREWGYEQGRTRTATEQKIVPRHVTGDATHQL